MADQKISELTAASQLSGSESIPGVQSGSTKKTTAREIAAIGYQSIVTDNAASRTLALTDLGKYIRMTSGSANSITVPPNASVAFEIGTTLNGVQAGAGKTTISPGSGVTINKPTGYNSACRAQGAAWGLVKVATNEWDLFGDLEIT